MDQRRVIGPGGKPAPAEHRCDSDEDGITLRVLAPGAESEHNIARLHALTRRAPGQPSAASTVAPLGVAAAIFSPCDAPRRLKLASTFDSDGRQRRKRGRASTSWTESISSATVSIIGSTHYVAALCKPD